MNIEDLKVLLVEDDANTRSTIRAMLNEIGISRIFESKDGDEADVFIEMDATEVDLVISDWNMPNKSGLDFLQNLRAQRNDLPFIMVTGRADTNSVQDAMTAGVTSYIRKPFSVKDIETKIRSIHRKYYS